MPQHISAEKIAAMTVFGAKVRKCPPVPFEDPRHYYQTAKRISSEIPNAVWTNQFENLANFHAHYESTAPEIWRQTRGNIDGVCVSAGTGKCCRGSDVSW